VRAPAQANEQASTPWLTPLDLETPQIPLSSVDNKTSARYSGGQGTESNRDIQKKELISGNAPADGAQTARKPPPAPKPAPKNAAQKPAKPNLNLSLVQELSSLVEQRVSNRVTERQQKRELLSK